MSAAGLELIPASGMPGLGTGQGKDVRGMHIGMCGKTRINSIWILEVLLIT